MHPSFNIQTTGDGASRYLLAEIGRQGIAFVVREGSDHFTSVVCYHFDAATPVHEQLQEVLASESLLQQSFAKTDICWTFAESILTPHEYFNANAAEDMLALVYGDAVQGEVKTDFLFRHNIHNVYRVPAAVAKLVSDKFPYCNQSHLYSLLPDMTGKNGNQLFAIFSPKQLTAALLKDGAIQVIQTFAYDNGKDAAYHLLNVCQQFNSAPDDTKISLSGMIDERSNLYSELYKYFLHLEFEPLPGNFIYAEAIREQPEHFFSHLFATAACV